MKIVKIIKLKIVIFTAVKNRCILHGRVFVMTPLSITLYIRSMYVTKIPLNTKDVINHQGFNIGTLYNQLADLGSV